MGKLIIPNHRIIPDAYSEPVKGSLEDGSAHIDHGVTVGKYEGKIGKILIHGNNIQRAVQELASEIHQVYGNNTVHLVALMKGADMFCTDLQEAFKNDFSNRGTYTREDIRVSSYDGTQSTGNLVIEHKQLDVKGKNVIVVDDIVDTAVTMTGLVAKLESMGANDVKTATMLLKRTERNKLGYAPDFAAFEIPDEFVVGYGMDLHKDLDTHENYRDIIHICVPTRQILQPYLEKAS